MTRLPPTNAVSADAEGELARLCEEISDRLRRQEPVDLEDYAARWPAHADELRQLLPAMRMMAGIPTETPPTSADATVPVVTPNQSLGDFRIVREIGRGGMGIVYEAEQLSLRRNVALKVLPFAAVLDSRQLRRFHNEAQAAALLHHPQIVPVYGVGCERGVHYYAMQLIEGPTVAQVIRELRTHVGLDLPLPEETLTTAPLAGDGVDRIELPAKNVSAPVESAAVCTADPPSPSRSTVPHGILSTARTPRSPAFVQAAVQLGIDVAEALDYAHQEGIVHRDIKPGNLLLDARGKVWVADFGLARIEADPGMTLTGDLLGTLRYMSPEQALGKRVTIDGRTDVYSLGATLYELLTLKPVFDGDDRQAILRQIAFDEPRPLRQLDRALPVELETILLKTLAKNPDERYATAGALADDLRRFQEQKPIEARRPTMVDRTTKWALRNRRLVVAGALGLLLTVVTLLIASALIWNEQHKTQHALETAIAQRAAAERLRGQADRLRRDADQQRQQAMTEKLRADEQAAIARAVNEFLQQGLLGQASVDNQPASGDGRDANVKVRTLLDRASRAIEGTFIDQPLVEAAIRETIGTTYRALWLFPEAEPHLLRARELRERKLGSEHRETIESIHGLATLYVCQARFAEAEPLLTQLLAGQRRVLGPEHPDTLRTMGTVAHVYHATGRFSEAETLFNQVLEVERRVLGPDHLGRLLTMNNLATLYIGQTRFAEAESLLKEVLEAQRRLIGPEHPDTLTTVSNLAVVYKMTDRMAEAEQLFTQALEIQRHVLGPDHSETLTTMHNLASVYRVTGRFAEAETLFKQVLEISRRVRGPEHPETLTTVNSLAGLYEAQTRFADAEPLRREIVTLARAKFGLDAPQLAASQALLGQALLKQGQCTEAESVLRECLRIREWAEPDVWSTFNVQSMLGGSFLGQQRYDEATPLLVQGYEGMKQREDQIPAEGKVRLVEALERLVPLYEALEKPEEAAKWRGEWEALKQRLATPQQKST